MDFSTRQNLGRSKISKSNISYPLIACGLISIGRPWGFGDRVPPSQADALTFLAGAYDMGIRFFDTAPGYGSSEPRFGKFLQGLENADRNTVIVTTKMGEHWIDDAPIVDHSYDALCRSIDQSLERLGPIDLLQLHIATAENIVSGDVVRSIEYAKSCGIEKFGASMKDVKTADLACQSKLYHAIQITYNQLNQSMAPAFDLAEHYQMSVLINRPLAMGELALAQDKTVALQQAFEFVKTACPQGTILTGTKSLDHLAENLKSLKFVFD